MFKSLRINFIGLFGTSGTGEISDETHLARELENLGHVVTKVPRDVWKAHCDGHQANEDWVLPVEADFNIICKWPAFDSGKYIYILRNRTKAPVLYWSWDYFGWPNVPDWHKQMCKYADIHLTNELGDFEEMTKVIPDMVPYYFPMDVCDDEYAFYQNNDKKYDVVFFGSYFPTGGRLDLLKKVDEKFKLMIFSPDYLKWVDAGFQALPPVWGNELNKLISQSKICLQISVNNDCYGYWSNRVGKIIHAGGFMLAKYVPGMELTVGDAAAYFSTDEEALDKIGFYLKNFIARIEIHKRAKNIADRFSSATRMKQLSILMERIENGL